MTTVARSSAGSLKEEIESIRKNAPYLYASQNRMVTAEDYSSLILRNFPNQISDIKSWGGEDNIPPKYGSVFVSIDFSSENRCLENQKFDKIYIFDINRFGNSKNSQTCICC